MSKKSFRSVFREYDIRGRVNDQEINDDSVALIAKGFGTFLNRRNISRIVVGYDNRSYSPRFHQITVDNLVKCGLEVHDIGLSISPVLYFAQYHLQCQSGTIITASHNPDGWCGFKLAQDYSKTLGPEEVRELYTIVEQEAFTEGKKGTVKQVCVRDAYIDAVANRIKLNPQKTPRVVIDCANGATGVFAYEVFQRIGCMTFQLYCDPDTRYPNYFPNPSNLEATKRVSEMVTHPYIHADLGLGFDGDGDRIGFLDDQGNNVWSDRILMLLAHHLLKKQKGAKIVFDVKCTQALPEVIEAEGGIAVMWKTGHSYIKAKMHEVKAALAGERSGHIFVGGNEYYGFDDAIFTGAKLIEFLSQEGKSLAETLESFPRYVTSPEIKAHCPDDKKYVVVEELIKEFKKEYRDRVIDINGARVQFDKGWGLVRASSNLPELVLIFEGQTESDMQEIRQIFRQKLDRYDDIDKNWKNDI